MNDPVRALDGIDPVPDLDQRELEQAHVDDVTPVFADLDPVADRERPAENDEEPASEFRHGVLEGNGETARQDPQVSCPTRQITEPDHRDDDDRRSSQDLTGGLDQKILARDTGHAAYCDTMDQNPDDQE